MTPSPAVLRRRVNTLLRHSAAYYGIRLGRITPRLRRAFVLELEGISPGFVAEWTHSGGDPSTESGGGIAGGIAGAVILGGAALIAVGSGGLATPVELGLITAWATVVGGVGGAMIGDGLYGDDGDESGDGEDDEDDEDGGETGDESGGGGGTNGDWGPLEGALE